MSSTVTDASGKWGIWFINCFSGHLADCPGDDIGAAPRFGENATSFEQEIYGEKRPEKTKDFFTVSNLSFERIMSNFIDWKYTFHEDTPALSNIFNLSIGAVVCARSKQRKLSRSFRIFAAVSQNYEKKSNQV